MKRNLLWLFIVALVSACAVPPVAQSAQPSGRPSGFEQNVGSFEVNTSPHGPVKVFWAAGGGDLRSARVIVVMHGTNRNAADYRDAWIPLIAGQNAIVVAPEFDSEHFPGVNAYNLGGMWDDEDRPIKPESWTFNVVERVFDDLVRRVGSNQTSYDMFGHSAGAQFTHRFVEFMPTARLHRAISANAGWYTMLDDRRFPYGIGDVPGPHVDLQRLARADLTILLGANDTESENLRQDADANAQGATRLERGLEFYRVAHAAATAAGVDLAWTLTVVPGARHDYEEMSAAAAKILLA